MSIFRKQRETAPAMAVEKLAAPKPAETVESGPGQKIDRRKANKHVRTRQFNTKVGDGFLANLDQALQQFCASRGLDSVSRGYFLEVLLFNWMQANGQEVQPYGLPPLALRHAEAIAERMNWSVSQAIEDAIAVRCKDLGIDLNDQGPRRERSSTT
jgi:hypothetical protein